MDTPIGAVLSSHPRWRIFRPPFSTRWCISQPPFTVGLISSPLLLLFALFLIINTISSFVTLRTQNIMNVMNTLIWAEPISWLPRGYIVWRAWRRLLREG